MKIETNTSPTHIAHVIRRFNFCSPDDLAARFLETSYIAESALKSIAVTLHGGIERTAKEVAYRHAYELVRADGLGTWEFAIRDLTTPPIASYLPPEYHTLLTWIARKRTKPEDEQFRTILNGIRSILSLLGSEITESAKNTTARELLTLLVQLRNKTKAHGAVGEEFYAAANGPYISAVRMIIETCPVFSWKWVHLSKRESGKTRAIGLLGLEPTHIPDSEVSAITFDSAGIFVLPEQSTRAR